MPKILISKQKLKEVILESVFDPKATGPMKVIADENDPRYCEMRALEFIEEARKLIPLMQGEPTPVVLAHQARYHECMKTAISLIGLARLGRPIAVLTNATIEKEGNQGA